MSDKVDQEVQARLVSLLSGEGWPLIRRLFADCEMHELTTIRHCPVGPDAEVAAVRLAHIEDLRDHIRSITPSHYGDPFDAAERPRIHREPDPEPEDDDYAL